MKNILIALPELTPQHRSKLENAAEGCVIKYSAASAVTAEDVNWAGIIIGNIPPSLLHEPERLEFMQLSSAGADAYVAPGLLKKDVVLTNCTGAYSQAVAEHAFAATLMLLKKLHLYRDDQTKKRWADEGLVSSIDGSTVLVMGLGDIGCCYARMAKALNAYVIGVKRRSSGKPDCVDELYTTEDFDKIVNRADIIVSFLPGTTLTTHFYTAERFKAMKDSAIFVNCGRGNAVSAQVLCEALKNRDIESAAVDVFETEPLPADSPLWELDNLMLTPHASGFFHLPATINRVVDICAYNLGAFLKNEALKNVVDFNTGYKK